MSRRNRYSNIADQDELAVIQGAQKLISGLLRGLDPEMRRNVALAAVSDAGREGKIPVAFPCSAFPSDMTSDEAATQLSGYGALIYAIAPFPKTSKVPISRVWQLAESSASGTPVLGGDPDEGSIPAAAAAMLVADAITPSDPTTAKELKQMARPWLDYHCLDHEGPLATVTYREVPMTGGKLKDAFSKIGKGIKNAGKKAVDLAKAVAETSENASLGKQVKAAVEEQNKEFISGLPYSTILNASLGLDDITSKKRIAELESLGITNGVARMLVAMAMMDNSDPVAAVKSTAVSHGWTMPTAARYLLMIASGSTPDEALSILEGTNNDGPSWQNDLTKYMEDLDSSLGQYRSRIQATADRMKLTANSARKAACNYARLQWADAILRAPDDAAELLSSVEPQSTSASDLMTSMLQLIPAAKAQGSASTLGVMFSALRNSGLPNALGLLGLSGDPTEACETVDSVDPVTNPVGRAMLVNLGVASPVDDATDPHDAEIISNEDIAQTDAITEEDVAPVEEEQLPEEQDLEGGEEAAGHDEEV